MKFKLVLALVLIAFFWLVDGCNRNNKNKCKDNRHVSECKCKRHKRSVQGYGTNFSIKLQADPCDFNTYDADQDGAITNDEFHDVLGICKETSALFTALTIMTDDGDSVIKPYEFNAIVPLIITECFNLENK